MTMTPILELTNVSKGFASGRDRSEVLCGVNLSVRDGEFLAILGFSGTGKTTLVNLMAGLTQPDAGSVRFRGIPVTTPGPERGVVFQSYSLMPWMTVAGNIGLGVDAVPGNRSKAERAALIAKYTAMVGLGAAADRRPAELSGGMRQRVAVARALALKPRLLLLDEPFAALDAQTRKLMQRFLLDVQRISDAAIVLVTHDIDEAVALADRVLVMTARPGRIKAEIPVTEPRPRDPFAQGYLHAARTVAEAVRDEVDIAFSRETRLPH